MSFDDAQKAVQGLADAAKEASQNIPNVYKLAAAVIAATTPIQPSTSGPNIWTHRPPVTGGETPTATTVHQTNTYQVTVNAKDKSARQIFDELDAEAQRRTLAATGQTV